MITDGEYSKLIVILDAFFDSVGNDDTHDLMPVIDWIANLIEEYDCKQNL